jgi:hypothetical protein
VVEDPSGHGRTGPNPDGVRYGRTTPGVGHRARSRLATA